MVFLVLKAVHICAVVAWFAGLFYIVRLFVYLAEAQERPAAEREVLVPQLRLMAWRLWFGITWPAAVVACGAGLAMLQWFWPPPDWLVAKLAFVGGLAAYHLGCHWLHQRVQAGPSPWSGRALRVWNEVATVFLVAIVFLVVLKDALAMAWGLAGLAALTAVLLVAIAAYRRVRAR